MMLSGLQLAPPLQPLRFASLAAWLMTAGLVLAPSPAVPSGESSDRPLSAKQGSAEHELVLVEHGFTASHSNAEQRFTYAGGVLRVLRGESSGPEGGLDLEFQAWGRPGRMAPSGPGELAVRANRADIRREGLVEWYVNGPAGLEQGFTVVRPPAQDREQPEPLAIQLAWRGSLLPLVEDSARSAVFVSAGDGTRYCYSGLRAWAADGQELAARLELDDHRLSILVDDEGARYPLTIDPLCAVEQAKVKAGDGAAGDNFGIANDVDGDTAVIAARFDDGIGADSGSAYVFVRSGSAWNQQAKLTASDAAAGDQFGTAVAISGNTIVVGAASDDDFGSNSGSVYVFVRNGTTWSQQTKLVASDGASLDFFGSTVDVHVNTAVVGASLNDDAGSASGSAYVFVRSGTNWTQQAKLTASDAASGDQFGFSVSISGNTLAIGSPQDDDGGTGSGSAYVFLRSGVSWSQQAKLSASDAASGDQFGISLSASVDRVLVGAWTHDGVGVDSGAAYVFARSGSTWSQEALLTASDAAANDNFGRAVALDSEGPCPRALIGAPAEDPSGFPDAGSSYTFERDGAWTQRAKLVASDKGGFDSAGLALGLTGDYAVIGAYHDDDNGSDSGSAYLWDLSDTTQPLINGCADFTACLGPGGGIVNYPVFATDNCDPDPTLVCSPPSGSFLTPGSHTVFCTATDCAGNSTSCSFTVCVDGAAPTFVAPLPVSEIFTCTSPLGSILFYDCPTAIDDCDPAPEVECVPPSGSFVPPGIHTITCTATDECGREAIYTFTITLVADTTDPEVFCNPPFQNPVECNATGGANVGFGATALDDCDGPLNATCTPGPGFYPRGGPYNITCRATDVAGNTGSCSFAFTVQDTTDPVITCPVNKVVECGDPVTFAATAVDICDSHPTITYDLNPGGTAGQGNFPLGVTTVTCTAEDDAGNESTCTFTVTVQDTRAPTITPPSLSPVEATGPDGAVVTFTVTVTDGCDMDLTPECSPPSGSVFGLGTTSVHCTVTDDEGNEGTLDFDVTVEDTTPPAVTCPDTIQVLCAGTSGTLVTYQATATDLVDPSPEITFAPPSGSLFPVGTTQVTCTATDDEGNEGTCAFAVVVTDTMPPVISCPGDLQAECQGPDGTAVSFEVLATDDCAAEPTLVCLPPSGSLFPLGVTMVVCTATDEAGNESSCFFAVTVEDTTPPELMCPPDQVIPCAPPDGSPFDYAVFALDVCDGVIPADCDPPPGSHFPPGTTQVVCLAVDASGNASQCSFFVTLQVDDMPPVLTCPPVVAECQGPDGTPVILAPTVMDDCDPVPAVTCLPPSGSLFPLGITSVSCVAFDATGNSTSCEFEVRVVDTTSPVIVCPPNKTLSAFGPTSVSYTVSASDVCDPSPTVTCAPPSGSIFGIGTTTVQCTARDDAGNVSNCSFTITVNQLVSQGVPAMGTGAMAVLVLSALALGGLMIARQRPM